MALFGHLPILARGSCPVQARSGRFAEPRLNLLAGQGAAQIVVPRHARPVHYAAGDVDGGRISVDALSPEVSVGLRGREAQVKLAGARERLAVAAGGSL
jgi:hypothetical protein